MKVLWMVMTINGVVEAYTPVGYTSMKACEEKAARHLMLTVHMMGRINFRCVTR